MGAEGGAEDDFWHAAVASIQHRLQKNFIYSPSSTAYSYGGFLGPRKCLLSEPIQQTNAVYTIQNSMYTHISHKMVAQNLKILFGFMIVSP